MRKADLQKYSSTDDDDNSGSFEVRDVWKSRIHFTSTLQTVLQTSWCFCHSSCILVLNLPIVSVRLVVGMFYAGLLQDPSTWLPNILRGAHHQQNAVSTGGPVLLDPTPPSLPARRPSPNTTPTASPRQQRFLTTRYTYYIALLCCSVLV